MKNRIARVLVPAIAAITCVMPAAFAAEYEIDPVHSSLIYRISHLGVGYHHGFIPDFAGTLTFDPEALDEAAISITAQAASINSLHAGRDEHLKGEDFFKVAEFATISFEGDAWESTGVDSYAVTGTFTLLGVAREITVPVTKIGEGVNRDGEALIGFEGKVTIKRSEFGMNYGLDNLGDEVTIMITIEAAQKAAE